MESLFQLVLHNPTLKELARSWRVTPAQAARRLRVLPFVELGRGTNPAGTPGRPGLRLGLRAEWRFRDRSGNRPLTALLGLLRSLHACGEPFGLGVPFTSAYWRPFLHPDVRLLVPPETLSVWYRLFHGPAGTLNVVVEELPPGATVRELEGLPVLAPESAVVDALEAFQERRNGNLLALVDTLVHGLDTLDPTLALAGNRGLEGDVAFLRDHRRRGGTRLLGPRDVRRAHEVEADLAGVPPGTRFTDLVTSREAYRP